MYQQSTFLIVNNIDKTISEVIASLPLYSSRVIQNEEEGKSEFLLIHSKKALKEAYIATNEIKYIILAADSFRIEAQNSLLKILEEPPENIIFIIISSSKNSILPTILSRLQVKYLRTKKEMIESPLRIEKLDLKDIYHFLKQNQRVSKSEAKEIIESILYTVYKQNLKLDKQTLDCFDKSIKLLELNSKPLNILTMLLLNLANHK